MTILYAVICRSKDAAVLAEFISEAMPVGSNAPQVTVALLEHLRDNPAAVQDGDMTTYVHRNDGSNNKGSSSSGRKKNDDIFGSFLQACTVPLKTTDENLELGHVQENYFHLWNEKNVFYCCLSDDPNPKYQKVNFAFLQAIAKDFQGEYSARRIKNCNAYALDKQFKPRLRTAMDYYNTHQTELGQDAKINAMLTKVEDMKSTIGKNIHLLLERDQKLSRLVEKSEQAKADTEIFKKKSKKLEKEMRGKNTKLWLILASIFILLIFTFVVGKCGITFDKCGSSSGGD